MQELLQEGLKPSDLIWVEGKSAAWCYPTEIKELQPYLQPAGNAPEVQPTASSVQREPTIPVLTKKDDKPKKIFVSLPQKQTGKKAETPEPITDPIEQKAELLRQKLQNYQAQSTPSQYKQEIKPYYASTQEEVEPAYPKYASKQKRKDQHLLSNKYVQLAAIGLVVAGVFFVFKPSQNSPSGTITPTNTDYTVPVSNTEISNTDSESFAVSDNTVVEAEKSTQKWDQKTQKPKIESGTLAVEQNQTTEQQPVTTNDVVINENKVDSSEPEGGTEAVVQQKEKRKTVGQAIDDFFSQFKGKKNSEGGTAAKTSNGERKASKRDETAIEPPNPDQLASQIKVTATEPSSDWMMGLRGIKLTLHNQSSYKLKNAVVEVSYFDDQNALLEKKTVTFNNVPANKAVTRAAPDHRLATYAKHQLLSAGADEGSIANH